MTPSPAAKSRVLFVDDEPRILTSMRMQFRGQYEMQFADSGASALELLRTQPVEVIVSDQRMPGMSGYEFLRAARDLHPHAMRILLTGYSDLNAIIGSVNEGEIFRFVSKPWDNDVLAATVAAAAQAARASQQASETVEGPADVATAELPGVLVMDDDPLVGAKIQGILGEAFRVFVATSLDEAVGHLEQQRVGVLISDTRVQNQPVVSLIGTLKQHHPQLVSVILTERADAGSAIELINQGQIYRLITKPIQDVACRITVNSAHKQHQKLRQNPVLQQRYQVERSPEPLRAAAPPPTLRLLDRIRSLRGWARG